MCELVMYVHKASVQMQLAWLKTLKLPRLITLKLNLFEGFVYQ